MQPPEEEEPSGTDPEPIEREDSGEIDEERTKPEAIFTCKFPGCTRQYASTDGVRKHCRKSHAEWLRDVDLEKAANGCRWAAYCTREAITDTNDPRQTPVGSKRAREIMAAGGYVPGYAGSAAAALKRRESNVSERSERTEASPDEPKHRGPSLGLAMDGKSALRAPLPCERQASCENTLPPEMVCVPADLSSPLPVGVSSLTPNAQARWRLGAIADSESAALMGYNDKALAPASPLCDAANAPLPQAGGFFVQWAMPPIKRGVSLQDTREASVTAQLTPEETQTPSPYAHPEGDMLHHDSPSFLDSVLA